MIINARLEVEDAQVEDPKEAMRLEADIRKAASKRGGKVLSLTRGEAHDAEAPGAEPTIEKYEMDSKAIVLALFVADSRARELATNALRLVERAYQHGEDSVGPWGPYETDKVGVSLLYSLGAQAVLDKGENPRLELRPSEVTAYRTARTLILEGLDERPIEPDWAA